MEEIELLRAEKAHAESLLQQALAENEALRARVALLERYRTHIDGHKAPLPPPPRTERRSFCKEVADVLCEELVLLDEDIAFIGAIVKPPPFDPYASTLGKTKTSKEIAAAAAQKKKDEEQQESGEKPVPSMSVSEHLLEQSLRQQGPGGGRAHHAPLYSLDEE